MDLFKASKKMRKQPSPIKYLLKDQQKETDELPDLEWGADHAPPKLGAVHRRPRDPRVSTAKLCRLKFLIELTVSRIPFRLSPHQSQSLSQRLSNDRPRRCRRNSPRKHRWRRPATKCRMATQQQQANVCQMAALRATGIMSQAQLQPMCCPSLHQISRLHL